MSTLQPPTISQQTPPWANKPAPGTAEAGGEPAVPTAPPVPPAPPAPPVPAAATAPVVQAPEEFPTQDNAALLASVTQTGQQVLKELVDKLPEDVRADLCVDEGCPHHGTDHVCVDSNGVPNGCEVPKVDFSALFAAHNIPPVPHKDEDEQYVQHLGRFSLPADQDASVVSTEAQVGGEQLQQGDTATQMLDKPEVCAEGFVEAPEAPIDFLVDGAVPERIGEIPDNLFPADAPLPVDGYVGCALVPTYKNGELHVEVFPYYYKAPQHNGKRGRPQAHRVRFWEPREYYLPQSTSLESAIKRILSEVLPAEQNFGAVLHIATGKRQHCVKVDGIIYNTGKDESYWFAPTRLKVLLLS